MMVSKSTKKKKVDSRIETLRPYFSDLVALNPSGDPETDILSIHDKVAMSGFVSAEA